MADRARLAVLLSGRGRNLQALLEAVGDRRIDADMAVVISNRADAPGLGIAAAAGVATRVLPHAEYADRAAFDAALADELQAHRPDIVALAGFMRVLGDAFVDQFAGRMLNIHPSLLPRYPGLRTHQRALDAGDAEHGATVHFVTRALDGGPAVIQGRLPVRTAESAEQLAARVLEEIELKIYPQAVAWMARGELALRDGYVRWRGAALAAPLGLADLEDAFR